MNTAPPTTQTPEVAMIQADCKPIEGWHVHWLISRKQIEYLLTDIISLPANNEQPHLLRAQYLDHSLPVIHLEQYFGINEEEPRSTYRYLVTKSPTKEQRITRAILKIGHPVRMRKLTFNSTPTLHSTIPVNGHHILGAYTMPDNVIVVVPDIVAIVNHIDK